MVVTHDDLLKFRSIVGLLSNVNSVTAKKEILTTCTEADKVLLRYTFDELTKMYGVTSANCIKRSDLCNGQEFTDIITLLDSLAARKITGHDAIAAVNTFVANNSDCKDIIYKIIDRDIQCGVSTSIVNKVFKKLIPEFNVTLAYSFKDYVDSIDFTKTKFGVTRKIDGVRTIAIIRNGDVKFYSRVGSEFTSLTKVKEEILALGLDNVVLDGEMCMINEDGSENFKSIVSEIKRKTHTIEKPKYLIFDFLTLEEFGNEYADIGILDRYSRYQSYIDIINTKAKFMSVMDQVVITSEDEFNEWVAKASVNGWEGIMIRNIESPYEAKRTKHLLKVKKFSDAEFKVLDYEVGPFQHVIYKFNDGRVALSNPANSVKLKQPVMYFVDKNGTWELADNQTSALVMEFTSLRVTSEMLTNVHIMYKGNTVSVGSGFSVYDRIRYRNEPKLIQDKIITVQWFEESADKNGKLSLRFPTVKHVFEGKREV